MSWDLYFVISSELVLILHCPFLSITKSKLLIKVKVKVKFALEQVTKAQRASRGIALLCP
jgi:hypothetical protein